MFIEKIKYHKEDFKLINSLVIPWLLTQIIQILFQFGDQAIVGRLSIQEFAAVGVSSSFIYLITGTIGILATAFNIHGGKKFGQGDIPYFGRTFNTSMTLAIVIGIVSECVILVFGELILKYIYGLESDVIKPARQYLNITGIAIGLNTVIFIFSAYFKNIRKTKIFLVSFTFGSIINIFFDYVLVFGKLGFPEIGVSGAAIGSILGYITIIMISIGSFRKNTYFQFSITWDKEILRRIIKLYIPLALQDLVEFTLFAIGLSMIVARLSTAHLASYNVMTTLLEIIMLPMYGYSATCMTLTAQANGQDNNKLKYLFLSSILMYAVVIPFSGLFTLFAVPITKIITNQSDIIQIVSHVFILVTFVNLFNGLQMMIKSALQSLNSEKWVLYYSFIIYSLSCVMIYFLSHTYHISGVYMGLGMCYILLSIGYLFKIKQLNVSGSEVVNLFVSDK